MSKLENLHNMMEKLSAQCAEWLADGTKTDIVRDVVFTNLKDYFDFEIACAMTHDVMDMAAKKALDILEERSKEEPISLCTMYGIING